MTYPQLPPPRPKHPVRNTVLVVLLLAVLLLVVIITVVFAISRHGSGNVATDSSPTLVPDSNSDQWKAAVCKLGTYYNGGGPVNAVATGNCLSPRGTLIMMGLYNSEYDAQDAAARYRRMGSSSATTPTTTGTLVMIALNDRTGINLEPLSEFPNFTITTP
jgi:hypothetical protein